MPAVCKRWKLVRTLNSLSISRCKNGPFYETVRVEWYVSVTRILFLRRKWRAKVHTTTIVKQVTTRHSSLSMSLVFLVSDRQRSQRDERSRCLYDCVLAFHRLLSTVVFALVPLYRESVLEIIREIIPIICLP